jgi:hypothetical protein
MTPDVTRDHVTISLPADVDFVVLARFTAATVAARANFDIDEIEDLRLAVDELCISFGPLVEKDTLRLEFDRSDRLVKITCRFESGDRDRNNEPDTPEWKRTDDLSRQLLDALVDAHGREMTDSGPCAWLEKRGSSHG